MIAIIDYDTGNLRSVANALGRLGADYVVTADHQAIRRADHVILPGVGEASSAMAKLHDRGLDVLVPTLTQPVLGICIGMQLMCRHSDEGDVPCLGIFDTEVRRLRENYELRITNYDKENCELRITNYDNHPRENYELRITNYDNPLKVPHMGWDTVNYELRNTNYDKARDVLGIGEHTYFYYVHSYAADICADTVAVTDYCRPFSAILQRGNFTGVQFHPEKSGASGARLLAAWLTT